MNGTVFLLVAAFALPLLAGCADPAGPGPTVESPGLVAVAPTDLSVGGFYAFRHDGGELVFQTEGDVAADVVLYGGDDRRIGRIGLGGDGAAGRFTIDNVDAGELVVEVRALDGGDGIDIRSGGSRVRDFQALPTHIERRVLLQRQNDAVSQFGIPTAALQPADENVDFELLRAPSSLRLLLQGNYQDLAVAVVGEDGVVLRAEEPGGPVGPQGFGTFSFEEIPSQSFGENVRDGSLSAQVSAADFRGVLLLEATSFSRARAAPSDVQATDEEPRFTYGVLPEQPVTFHVKAGTQWLYLLYEGDDSGSKACRDAAEEAGADPEKACGEAALVALFGPDDQRVATVHVPFNQTVAIPAVAEGEWVAVLLDGEATLGADRVPADFELHPIEVRSGAVPTDAASAQTGEYGQAEAPVQGQGVVFRITGEFRGATVFQFPLGFGPGCSPATLVARQGGETIGAWGFGADANANPNDADTAPRGTMDPNGFLDGSPLSVVYDDFGPDCNRMVLAVDGYVR